jgi:hypothetical protein
LGVSSDVSLAMFGVMLAANMLAPGLIPEHPPLGQALAGAPIENPEGLRRGACPRGWHCFRG